MTKAMHRVQVDLCKDDIEFLNKISVEAKFTNGKTIPRSTCIRALLAAIKELDLPPSSFRDGDALLEAVRESGLGRQP